MIFWFSILISFLGSPSGCIRERKQDCVFRGKEQGGKDTREKDVIQI